MQTPETPWKTAGNHSMRGAAQLYFAVHEAHVPQTPLLAHLAAARIRPAGDTPALPRTTRPRPGPGLVIASRRPAPLAYHPREPGTLLPGAGPRPARAPGP